MIAIASFTPSRRKKMNSNNTKDKFIPNSFQTPNAYVDEGIIALLTGDETKLLFIAIRHILGWADKRVTRQDNISLSQFQKSSGLARKTVIESMRRLARFNIVRMVKQGSPQDNEATLWELNLGQHGDINLDELEKRQDEQDGVNKMRIQKLNKAREEKKEQGGSHNPNHDVSSEPQPGSCDEPQPSSCDEPRPSSCDEHTKPSKPILINSSIPGPVITPGGNYPGNEERKGKTHIEQETTWDDVASALGTTSFNFSAKEQELTLHWQSIGFTPNRVLSLIYEMQDAGETPTTLTYLARRVNSLAA